MLLILQIRLDTPQEDTCVFTCFIKTKEFKRIVVKIVLSTELEHRILTSWHATMLHIVTLQVTMLHFVTLHVTTLQVTRRHVTSYTSLRYKLSRAT